MSDGIGDEGGLVDGHPQELIDFQASEFWRAFLWERGYTRIPPSATPCQARRRKTGKADKSVPCAGCRELRAVVTDLNAALVVLEQIIRRLQRGRG